MNWSHLSAFLWLRWRLRYNQIRRAGVVNLVITLIFLISMVPGAVILFVAAFCVGAFAVPLVDPALLPKILMFIWDGIVVVFLASWSIGILAELQRSEALSMDKFLHLPVSLSGVFLINYVSSLFSLTLLMFVPILVGFALGLSVGVGPLMLAMLPLAMALLFAVTALSYQFQGWLATLMANPRRRRTIVVMLTMMMILICQLPNLINMMQPWNTRTHRERAAEQLAENEKLKKSFNDGAIQLQEFLKEQEALNRKYMNKPDFAPETIAQAEAALRIANYVLPPLWLALGAEAAAEGNVLPALLGTLGLALIGTASLWRAYRTTIRLYTGEYTMSPAKAAPPVAKEPKERKVAPPPVGTALLERNLPWISERASAIALAGFRGLLRAPEAKMILLTPLILVLVFGSMFMSNSVVPPVMFRPFIGFGAMAMILLGMTQLIGNQFGFDRNGFRVFVLCPAPRRDILLGKNMAAAPVALGLGAVLILIVEVIVPMRIDHFVVVLIQAVAMYLLYCLLANTLSIIAPMPVAATSLKPVKPKALQVLLHVAFAMLLPVVMAPLVLPLVVDLVLEELELVEGVPIGLALMVLECAAVVYLYRIALGWQGKLLQAREQKILETVTSKAE